jgi:predicted transcriptional regulator
MTRPKIKTMRALRAEMLAVAKGKRRAPKDAAVPSFESVDVLMRLLTPENRALMATIRDKRPASIAALGKLTGRAPSNLTRTLQKLEAAGLVKMKVFRNTKAPVAAVRRLKLEIDPFSRHDIIAAE